MTLSKRKKILYSLITALFAVVLVFIVGELSTRVYYALNPEPKPTPPYDYRVLDNKFGWLTKADYVYNGSMSDNVGNKYPLKISTNEYGFKTFGDLNTKDKIKVFFIGDSYTQSMEVSNDKSFHYLLQDSLPIECFSYGAAGFGTMQELMITKKFIDLINPDILILQVCSNDYMDNYPDLARAAIYRVGKRRPYSTLDGNVVYETTGSKLEALKPYSTFIYFIATKFENIKKKNTKIIEPEPDPAEKLIAFQGRDYALYNQSINVTEVVIKQFKELTANRCQLAVFDADHHQPQYKDFKQICEANDIRFIDGVSFLVKAKQNAGEVVRARDGYHWNERGHELVAAGLLPALSEIVNELSAQ